MMRTCGAIVHAGGCLKANCAHSIDGETSQRKRPRPASSALPKMRPGRPPCSPVPCPRLRLTHHARLRPLQPRPSSAAHGPRDRAEQYDQNQHTKDTQSKVPITCQLGQLVVAARNTAVVRHTQPPSPIRQQRNQAHRAPPPPPPCPSKRTPYGADAPHRRRLPLLADPSSVAASCRSKAASSWATWSRSSMANTLASLTSTTRPSTPSTRRAVSRPAASTAALSWATRDDTVRRDSRSDRRAVRDATAPARCASLGGGGGSRTARRADAAAVVSVMLRRRAAGRGGVWQTRTRVQGKVVMDNREGTETMEAAESEECCRN